MQQTVEATKLMIKYIDMIRVMFYFGWTVGVFCWEHPQTWQRRVASASP